MSIHFPIKILRLDRWTHPYALPLVSMVISVHITYTCSPSPRGHKYTCMYKYMCEGTRGQPWVSFLRNHLSTFLFEVESFPELRTNSLFYLVSWPVNLGDSPVSAPALALPLQTHATIPDFSYWCWKRNSDAQISHLPRSTVLFWVHVFTFPFPSCRTGVTSTFYHVEKYIRCCRKLPKLPALVLLFVCLFVCWE